MKSSTHDAADGSSLRAPRAKARRRTISDILKAAYSAFGRDPYSKRAVKFVLR